jgi:hypothetical protein
VASDRIVSGGTGQMTPVLQLTFGCGFETTSTRSTAGFQVATSIKHCQVEAAISKDFELTWPFTT